MTDQSIWDIPADEAEVGDNEGHQVCAHIDGCLFKLILQKAIGKLSSFGLKVASINICNKTSNLP